MQSEPDMSMIGALIGEPSRALILAALMSGEALPASELAYRAQVTPQTASSHLSKLLDGGLITVTTVGRHRYYALKNHEIAQVLETLQSIAPFSKTVPPRKRKIDPILHQARTCYDHLAGELGVAVTNALLEKKYLYLDEQHYHLTETGDVWVQSLEIDVDDLKKKRRKFAYACVDWSERHYHLAGSLGAAVTDVFFEKKWIERLPHTRALKITKSGERVLQDDFGIQLQK